MKLSKWAKKQGIHYQTAWKWFKAGQIKNAFMTESGTILVNEEDDITSDVKKAVVYCRVSNFSRKKELEYQVDRCNEYAVKAGFVVDKVYKEVASGMNENRKALWKMLESKPSYIIVENKDRLSRFGFCYLARLLGSMNCEVIVINKSQEDREDLVKDLVSIIYSFCARLYGMRRAKNKADKIKNSIEL